jgi:hypothetical protein
VAAGVPYLRESEQEQAGRRKGIFFFSDPFFKTQAQAFFYRSPHLRVISDVSRHVEMARSHRRSKLGWEETVSVTVLKMLGMAMTFLFPHAKRLPHSGCTSEGWALRSGLCVCRLHGETNLLNKVDICMYTLMLSPSALLVIWNPAAQCISAWNKKQRRYHRKEEGVLLGAGKSRLDMSFVAGSVANASGGLPVVCSIRSSGWLQIKKERKKHKRKCLKFESSEFDNFASRSKVRAQARSDWMTRLAFT